MHAYLKSHPMLTFSLDLSKLDFRTWILLGECCSKCEHISGVPLRPQTEKEIQALYLAKGVQATTAIEGNTLTEEQVAGIISGVHKSPPSREYLDTEVRNVVNACNMIAGSIRAHQSIPLIPESICNLNAMVLANLPKEEHVVPGEFRTTSVGVGGYRAVPAQDVAFLMDKYRDWLQDENAWRICKDNPLASCIVKAIAAHLYFVWIHPFGDGNGRTARLIELKILLDGGVPMPAAHLLSNHYNLTRTEYYRMLGEAGKTSDPCRFVTYALKGFRDGLREQLGKIREMQWDITWRNYVHESFKGLKSTTYERRRLLALDISRATHPVSIANMSVMTPELAVLYSGRTIKTIQRDVKYLADKKLIVQTADGWQANRDIILSFLPLRSTKQ
jgi:Fic family protein